MMEDRKKDEKKDKIREEDKGEEEINRMHNNESELGQRVRKE